MKTIKHKNPDGTEVNIYVGDGAIIGESATIGEYARIGGGAIIGRGARIGEWAIIGEYARIGECATIGEYARIGGGAIIGRGASIPAETRLGNGIISAGEDIRGYHFRATRTEAGWYISAGCRWFTIAEARKHWAGNAEALGKTKYLVAEIERQFGKADTRR